MQNGIKCLYTNTDVLHNKLEEIQLVVDREKIELAAITETLPKTNQSCKPIFILPGYECLSNNDGRGVALFIKEGTEYSRIEEYENIFSPAIVCNIKPRGVENFIITVIYRSPNSEEVENTRLKELMTTICVKHRHDKIIIMGDFNCPEIDWKNDTCNKPDSHIASQFLQCTQENYLNQIIESPTHFRGTQNPTLIDLLLTNEENFIINQGIHPPFGKSHHAVLTFTIDLNPTNIINKPIMKYQLYKGDYPKMRTHLSEVDWDEVMSEEKSLDDINDRLMGVLDTVTELFIPKRYVNKNNSINRTFAAPEILLRALKLKKSSFGRFKKFPTDTNHEEYAKYRNIVNNEVKKAKRQKERTVAEEAKTNPKALFQYISSKTKPKESIPNLERKDGSTTENDIQKVKVLSDYFKSVYTNEDTSLLPNFDKKTVNTLSNVNISEVGITKALINLNVNKSPGPDGVHPKILKECAEQLSYPLKRLFERTMEEGRIPKSWKTAEVRPIFKKGKKSLPGNYRPVSLTSILCKICESFVRRDLYSHLVDNNLLSKSQFGFCQGRSCVSQLLVTLRDWMEDIDNNIPVDVAYMDFRKAFDSVPHQRLLIKLEGYGITGNLYSWIKDFLSNRNQFVSTSGTRSENVPVTSGVPQGSVLGPTLFIYFINDLPSVPYCNNKIFADDTKVYQAVRSLADQEILQKSINDMVDWSLIWLLLFNSEKCSILHLGNNNPKYKYTIKHDNDIQPLKVTTAEKDLGVIIDPLLNFDTHITQQIKKARGISAMILRSITGRTRDILIPLYTAIIRPNIEYANVVWNPYKRKDIDRVERVQRQFTKKIEGLSKLSYTDRLEKIKLPSLEYRRLRGELIEVYKITHDVYDPLTTTNLLNYETHKRTRSHTLKLHKYRFKTSKFQNFFTNRIINSWNALPRLIVTSESLNTFKNRIDLHFHEYKYSINIVIEKTVVK